MTTNPLTLSETPRPINRPPCHMLGFWRATIARVEKSIEKHADAADRRTLN
jgi:hypothetical protein